MSTPTRTCRSLPLPRPYDVAWVLGFLGQRVLTGLEIASERSYARLLRMPGGPAVLQVEFHADAIEVTVETGDRIDAETVLERCRWLLDLDTDLSVVERRLGADDTLAGSVRAYPGLRVPGHVDGFEVAVRAVVGQQISVAGARTILSRLVGEHGQPVVSSQPGLCRCFPDPDVLAGVDPERLPMPRARGRALVGLAAAVADGAVVLDRSVPLVEAREALLALPGIGPWTADYIALRALGDPDVFMATDLGVRHGLARLGVPAAAPKLFERWSPWRSYALMHVWKALEQDV